MVLGVTYLIAVVQGLHPWTLLMVLKPVILEEERPRNGEEEEEVGVGFKVLGSVTTTSPLPLETTTWLPPPEASEVGVLIPLLNALL